MSLSISVAEGPALRDAALALLYSRLSRSEREQQMAETLSAVERREISLENLLVALEGDRVVGSALAVRRPGRIAFLWPPVVCEEPAPSAVVQALLDALAWRVDAQHVLMTQCLLTPDDAAGRTSLESGGFPYVTDLMLLSRSLGDVTPQSENPGLTVACYTAELHNVFAQVVQRTYEGTLDCPALAQIRSGEESLDSHRVTGEFRPEGWRIYRSLGQDVGVVLLAEHPDRDAWEVAYLGVIPESRRRGLGRAILSEALCFAAGSGRSTIEVAADAGNSPALGLYRRLGFQDIRRFAVHLRIHRAGHEARAQRAL